MIRSYKLVNDLIGTGLEYLIIIDKKFLRELNLKKGDWVCINIKKMDEVNSNGQMVINMKVSSPTMTCMAMELTAGRMEESTRGSGCLIK